MPHGVMDEAFGTIYWGNDEWVTRATLPYFHNCGKHVPLTSADMKELGTRDRIEMHIHTGDTRRKPDQRQREAWKKIRRRGVKLWDEVMDALIAEYKRQRPRRVQYWQVCGDKRLLKQMLPERVTRKTMWRMVIPIMGMVEWPDPKHGTVDVFVAFMATWFNEALSVYIRDGRVTEVIPLGWLGNRQMPWTETVTFGILRRRPKTREWSGEVEIEPFSSWAAVAVDRRKWDEQYGRNDERSSLPFSPAHGSSLLLIDAPPEELPSVRQEAAFNEVARDGRAAKEILGVLFQLYRQVSNERRKGNARSAPKLKTPDGLKDVTELDRVEVFPEEVGKGVAVGLVFRGSWTGSDGVGVRWRDGKVEQAGDWRLAEAGRYQQM